MARSPVSRLFRAHVAAGVALAALLLATAAASQGEELSWARIEHDALRGGGHVVYVTDVLPADGAGNPWLAVGYVVDSDGRRAPSAWTSLDGATWRRFDMQSTGASEPRDGPFHLARRGGTAVAVGNRFEGRLRPAAWSSTSPASWTAVRDPFDPLLAFAGLIDVVEAGPEGFVAVGVEHRPNQSSVQLFDSPDGKAWRVHGGFVTPPGEHFQPIGAAVTVERIVLVGDTARGGGSDGRIWVGSGASWSRVDAAPLGLEGPGFQQVAGIAWHPSHGFVSVGLTTLRGVETPTVWVSADGVVWTPLPEGSPPSGGVAGGMHEVDAVSTGFLASGSSDTGARIWRSADGRGWTTVPAPSVSSIGRSVYVASDGSRLVLGLLGQTGSLLFQRGGGEWRRVDRGPAFPAGSRGAAELRDVASAGGRVVAVGADGEGRPLVMVGRRAAWTRARFDDRAARLLAIAADRRGFTAVGWRLAGSRAALAVWVSRSGTSWRRVAGSPAAPVGAFVDVARDGSRLVAAALEPSARGLRSTVWRRTGGSWRPEALLGAGEARAICVGPNGATVVAVTGEGAGARILGWTRARTGRWPVEPELVARGGEALRCADGPGGTLIVGRTADGSGVVWRRTRPGAPWRATVLAVGGPPSIVADVVRDGTGFLATGSTGERGQNDLAVWRSPDGVAWTRLGGADHVFVEPGYQAGFGLVPVGTAIVVVGRSGAGNAGLWVAEEGPGP